MIPTGITAIVIIIGRIRLTIAAASGTVSRFNQVQVTVTATTGTVSRFKPAADILAEAGPALAREKE